MLLQFLSLSIMSLFLKQFVLTMPIVGEDLFAETPNIRIGRRHTSRVDRIPPLGTLYFYTRCNH